MLIIVILKIGEDDMGGSYFNILVNIHNNIFEDPPFGIRSCFKEFDEVNLLIEKLVVQDNINLDKFVNDVIRSVAIIFLYQPFRDENYRTVLGLVQFLLEYHGYNVHIDDLNNDYFNGIRIIPTIYDKEDIVCVDSYRIKLLKHINKKTRNI